MPQHDAAARLGVQHAARARQGPRDAAGAAGQGGGRVRRVPAADAVAVALVVLLIAVVVLAMSYMCKLAQQRTQPAVPTDAAVLTMGTLGVSTTMSSDLNPLQHSKTDDGL